MNIEDQDSPFESPDDGDVSDETPAETSTSPVERLFDGDAPGPSTTELQQEYGLNRNQSVAGRGILRVATGSGVPPVFEIVFGSVMWVMQRQQSDGEPVDVDAGTDPLGPGLDPESDDGR